MLNDLLFWLFFELFCRQIHWILPNILSWGMNSSVWSSLKGKHVVITGATGELGRELVKILSEKDVKLILVDTNEHKLTSLQEKLKLKNVISYIHSVNFNSENDFSFLDIYENIGLLINNTDFYKNPSLYLEEDDDNLISVNIRSTTRITRRVLEKMIERKFGFILNLGSFVSEMPFPYNASYAGSKAFLRSWSHSLHYEMKRFNIEVEYVESTFVLGSKKILANGILNGFGSTKHLVSCFPLFVMKCLLVFCPDFVLGRAVEWFHRKFHLEKRLEERNKRKMVALKKVYL
ncbi:oxidoreductase [Nosema bombycis CQ1]|uniref:Oxidoreductase n=1 Tax=Nosema bombycis (strain CQ1 / CVCC 102059) TaxID=578461 RepID=R0MAZ9_NOSB1|nr:oxidoreductase [Nosema bombycis CQ1]|eukprot:EOB11215.1 oxidoreductase [Nosema bombycis CQ1]